MKQAYQKLFIAAIMALTAISLMVVASYAWYTLAGNPSLAGVQINIGGTNTIKIAPDLVAEVDGNEVHYPGAFTETLQLSLYDEYDYLNNLSGLMPVSTSDGIHWFYSPTLDGAVETDNLSLSDFMLDETLKYANVDADEEDGEQGCYAYVDFWVVSPMDNCSLRLSVGSEIDGARTEGSYVVSLPQAEESDTSVSGYTLSGDKGEAMASARVGFLVNSEVSGDAAMLQYESSIAYNEQYRKLNGYFHESGSKLSDEEKSKYSFTIYEPNSTYHPNVGLSYIAEGTGLSYTSCEDGDYAITRPIGYLNGQNVLSDISDKLTVQKNSSWRTDSNGNLLLEQVFQSAITGKEMRPEDIDAYFYGERLQGQYDQYVNRADFFKSTADLYFSGNRSVVEKEQMGLLQSANATDDAVIVELERNVPQKIRMFVWLEGQDIDCVREACSEQIAIGIELAGSNQY